ncbi:MAG TPA: MMPL family transporter [Mycobacteriales bacterium]|nr:MMPL family transporter [Mycobacteriales bacterium]
MPSQLSHAVAAVTGRRAKFLVMLAWLVLTAVAVPLAGRLSGAEHNETKSWLPASAESTRVIDREAAFVSPNQLQAVVIYERKSGLSATDRSKIEADTAKLATLPHVVGGVHAVFSRDRQAAEIVVPVDLGAEAWRLSQGEVSTIYSVVRGQPGLSTWVTGPAGYAAASSDAFKGIDGTLLWSALAVVTVILLLTYRSPLLWLVPVAGAGVALVIAEAAVYLISQVGATVNAQSVGILTVLVFGAGTDYALLLVARYREELRRAGDRHAAMAVALRRAAPAIIASASTVSLSMLCLLFAETKSTQDLGPVAAIGVLVALLVMTTLLPAALVSCPRWVFWPRVPVPGSADPAPYGVWARIGRRIARRPRRIWVTAAIVLAGLAFGLLDLNANGLSYARAYTTKPAAITGGEVLARHFPAGAGSPVIVVADAKYAGLVATRCSDVPGISGVTPPVVRGSTAFVEATMASPPDSAAGFATVQRVRAAVHAVPGAHALVGGDSAVSLDVESAARHDRTLIVPIALLAVLLILALLLRALLAPVLLVATVVLSFAGSLGLSALVFRHVFGFAGAEAALPLYTFVFLVSLGIDYNIFLMTRVREESLRSGTRNGSLAALSATGGVITSAGAVLAGTFGVLGTLPLTTFAEIGFAVALGVLIDALVVRSVLVTAINLDLGDRIWWPSKRLSGRRQRHPDLGLGVAEGLPVLHESRR